MDNQEQQLQTLVIAIAILITVILIFFTLYSASRAFKEIVIIQSKIEHLFDKIDMNYIKGLQIQEPINESKQAQYLHKVFDKYHSKIISYQIISTFGQEYEQQMKQYNRMLFEIKRCIQRKKCCAKDKPQGLKLLKPRMSIYGFTYQLTLLLVWFLACLSTSIINKLDSEPDVYFYSGICTLIIAGISTILSLIIAQQIFRVYQSSFQNQILRIFNYKSNEQMYEIQTLGMQSKNFICKVFTFVALMCVAFSICVYQLMVMQYKLKIATGVIFLIAPLIDIIVLRQAALVFLTVINRIRSLRRRSYRHSKPRDSLINDSAMKKLDDQSMFEQPSNANDSTCLKDISMNQQEQRKNNSDLFGDYQNNQETQYYKINQLFKDAIQFEDTNIIEDEGEHKKLYIKNCQKVLANLNDDQKFCLFDMIILSYTEQTFGIKAAYKIAKKIEIHDNSFDFIEKLKDKVFNQSCDLEQQPLQEESSYSGLSMDQDDLCLIKQANYQILNLEIVQEVSEIEENSKSSKLSQSPFRKSRRIQIATLMKKIGSESRRGLHLMTQTARGGIFTEAKEAYDSYEISPYKQKFSSTQRYGTKMLDKSEGLTINSQRSVNSLSRHIKSAQSNRESSRKLTQSKSISVISDEESQALTREFNQLEDNENIDPNQNPFLDNQIDSQPKNETEDENYKQDNFDEEEEVDDDTSYISSSQDIQYTDEGCNQDQTGFPKRDFPFYDANDPLSQRLYSDDGVDNNTSIQFQNQSLINSSVVHYNQGEGLSLQDLYDERYLLKSEYQNFSQDMTQMTTPGTIPEQLQNMIRNQMSRQQSTKTLKRVESYKIYDESTIMKTYEKRKSMANLHSSNPKIKNSPYNQQLTSRSNRSQAKQLQEDDMQRTMNRSRSEQFRLTIQVDNQTMKRVASANSTFKQIREKNALNVKYLHRYDKFISPIQSISQDVSLCSHRSKRSNNSIALPSARDNIPIEDEDQMESMQISNTSNFYIVRPGTMPSRFVEPSIGNMTVQSISHMDSPTKDLSFMEQNMNKSTNFKTTLNLTKLQNANKKKLSIFNQSKLPIGLKGYLQNSEDKKDTLKVNKGFQNTKKVKLTRNVKKPLESQDSQNNTVLTVRFNENDGTAYDKFMNKMQRNGSTLNKQGLPPRASIMKKSLNQSRSEAQLPNKPVNLNQQRNKFFQQTKESLDNNSNGNNESFDKRSQSPSVRQTNRFNVHKPKNNGTNNSFYSNNESVNQNPKLITFYHLHSDKDVNESEQSIIY